LDLEPVRIRFPATLQRRLWSQGKLGKRRRWNSK
jgi:hypothetical protein